MAGILPSDIISPLRQNRMTQCANSAAEPPKAESAHRNPSTIRNAVTAPARDRKAQLDVLNESEILFLIHPVVFSAVSKSQMRDNGWLGLAAMQSHSHKAGFLMN